MLTCLRRIGQWYKDGQEARRLRSHFKQRLWQNLDNAWEVGPPGDMARLLTALGAMAKDDWTLVLWGIFDADIDAYAIAHASPIAVPQGYERDGRDGSVRAIPLTPETMRGLAEVAASASASLISIHTFVLAGDGLAVQWFDSPYEDFLIAKTVPRDDVDAFCEAIGAKIICESVDGDWGST